MKRFEIQLPKLEHPKGAKGSASVAVLVRLDAKEPELLLTKRTLSLPSHKGQISFPGGMWDETDQTFRETALRETLEEIGLSSEHIEVLGPLEQVETKGALPIFPWLGTVKSLPELTLSRHEVERVLYLPVERLVKEGLRETEIEVGKFKLKSFAIDVDGELVWGATARILFNLRNILMKK